MITTCDDAIIQLSRDKELKKMKKSKSNLKSISTRQSAEIEQRTEAVKMGTQ